MYIRPATSSPARYCVGSWGRSWSPGPVIAVEGARWRGGLARRCIPCCWITRWIGGAAADPAAVRVRCWGGRTAAARCASRRAIGCTSPMTTSCWPSWPGNTTHNTRPRPSRRRFPPGGDSPSAGRPAPEHDGTGERPPKALGPVVLHSTSAHRRRSDHMDPARCGTKPSAPTAGGGPRQPGPCPLRPDRHRRTTTHLARPASQCDRKIVITSPHDTARRSGLVREVPGAGICALRVARCGDQYAWAGMDR